MRALDPQLAVSPGNISICKPHNAPGGGAESYYMATLLEEGTLGMRRWS